MTTLNFMFPVSVHSYEVIFFPFYSVNHPISKTNEEVINAYPVTRRFHQINVI